MLENMEFPIAIPTFCQLLYEYENKLLIFEYFSRETHLFDWFTNLFFLQFNLVVDF